MKIHLPNSAFLGNIDPFLRSLDLSHPDTLEITAHKYWISIHPLVLGMVVAAGLSVKRVSCEKLEAASKHYLERMGLFRLLHIASGIKIKEHEAAGRFIPLTRITTSEELTEFVTDMIPLLHVQPQQAATIKYVVSELVRNVLEHAQAKQGAIVCAQFYKKSNTIRLGVVDGGVGIKATINQFHPTSGHLEAIRLALMPGITGTTGREGGSELNAGAGLFVLKSIAKASRGFFVLYSGDAAYKMLKSSKERVQLYADPFRDRHTALEHLPPWQGTAVGIDIPLDSTEEFTTLLDLIWGVYLKTIRERKKERYRRPRFI